MATIPDMSTPQPSEKNRLHVHFVQQDADASPTPTSISLGSPISPLNDSNAGVVSVVTTAPQQDNHSAGNTPQPPPYEPASISQLATATATQQTTQPCQKPSRYPGLPALDFQLYSPPLFELSSDCTTLRSFAPYLSSTPAALVSFILAQATVPPKPQIHITGRRNGRPDFALKLNLMHILVPEAGAHPSRRMDYLRIVAPGEPALRGGTRPSLEPDLGAQAGLEAWAERFVEDPAPVKAFVLERSVCNLDTRWLEAQIQRLVAGTGYSGTVAVTFPVTHARVVVQRSPDRASSKLFSGITTLFGGRRTYEVVKAVWPFASCPRREEDGDSSGDDAVAAERGPRTCVVQSEEQWWREWAQPIRHAVVTKRHGWVSSEDKLEAVMEGKGKGVGRVDWGDGAYDSR